MTIEWLAVASILMLSGVLWVFHRQAWGGGTTLPRAYRELHPDPQPQRPLPTPEYTCVEVRCSGCTIRHRLPEMAGVASSEAMLLQLRRHYQRQTCHACQAPMDLWLRRDVVHYAADGQALHFSLLRADVLRLIEWNSVIYSDLLTLPEPGGAQIRLLVETSEDAQV